MVSRRHCNCVTAHEGELLSGVIFIEPLEILRECTNLVLIAAHCLTSSRATRIRYSFCHHSLDFSNICFVLRRFLNVTTLYSLRRRKYNKYTHTHDVWIRLAPLNLDKCHIIRSSLPPQSVRSMESCRGIRFLSLALVLESCALGVSKNPAHCKDTPGFSVSS